MGGDGGVIATKRAYFVKVKKAREKRDPIEVSAQRWNTCALTNQPLQQPVRRAWFRTVLACVDQLQDMCSSAN